MNRPSEDNLDPLEEALALLERENLAFKNHWVWRELGMGPEEFFPRFENQIRSLKIPTQTWEDAMARARAASLVRHKEKKQIFNSQQWNWMKGVQV